MRAEQVRVQRRERKKSGEATSYAALRRVREKQSIGAGKNLKLMTPIDSAVGLRAFEGFARDAKEAGDVLAVRES